MDDDDDYYDGLLDGLFWFFWPKNGAQWLLYIALLFGILYLKERSHSHLPPATTTSARTSVAPDTQKQR